MRRGPARYNINTFAMYVMSYFRTEAEALHLAVSEDGLRWRALNEDRPILHGQVGSQTLRDPFVFRAEDGRFHLLATDGWYSECIVHAASADLIAWEPQTLVPVMGGIPHVRNCWAPECFWDREAGLYRLIWSSSTTAPNHPTDLNHRIWQTTTHDFQTFTPAELFFDPGYSVIDATVVRRDDGTYLMAFKDERGDNAGRQRPFGPNTDWKAIRVSTAPTGNGPWGEPSAFVTPSLTEGPALFRLPDGRTWAMIFDRFAHAGYAARVSHDDGQTWEPLPGPMVFPPGPRHASVLAVDDRLPLDQRPE